MDILQMNSMGLLRMIFMEWYFILLIFTSLYIPLNEVEGGILVSPCPSVCLSIYPYQQYATDPFHINTSCRATSRVSHVMFISKFQIFNFDFVLFWLGIQYDSIVWVIMGRWWVSSELTVLVYIDIWFSLKVLTVWMVQSSAAGKYSSIKLWLDVGMVDISCQLMWYVK